MKKRIGRRLVSLLLTVVTVLTMLPAMTLPARAATSGPLPCLDDKSIGLSFDGEEDDAWSVEGSQIIGQVQTYVNGLEIFSSNSTLTIRNNKTTRATLSFDYQLNFEVIASCKINGSGKKKNGNFSQVLDAGQTVTVYIRASGVIGSMAKITMTNIKLVADTSATVTFQPAENGSYTVNGGNPITEPYTHTQNAKNAYQVKATPAPGYKFMGWYDEAEGKYINTAPTTALNIEKNRTITARFTSSASALFETPNGQVFDNLNEAGTEAQKKLPSTITLIDKGQITGKYTIPAQVTLLIPFDAKKVLYTNKPASVETYQTPSVFRKLTMAPGSSITVNGAISVGGKHCHTMGKLGPSGPYGQIDMAAGSAITLNNGANLYAWGFITGEGQITATPGATVYEYFQLMDWRGGTATSGMLGNKHKVFPISQYYVQNIETALTLQAGAQEHAYISVSAKGVGTKSTPIDFIGSTNSLFRLAAGAEITKKYDPKTDRITYTTTGSASLDSLALSVAGYDMNSKDYVLPINNNMTLEILSGKVAVNCDAALLPGAQITIAQGAELNVASGKSLYVYDLAQWKKGYAYNSNDSGYAPVLYSPTKTGTRTLTNATIDVNGTLTAGGSVYTTQSGANICSSEGTGRFSQTGAPGTDTTTYQCTQADKDITYVSIPITPAQLQNRVGDPTPTAGSVANDTFTYCTCPTCGGKWGKNLQVAAIINGNGEQVKTYATLQEAVKQFSQSSSGNTYIKLLHNTTEDINISTRDIYLDLNGRTVTGDISTGGYKLYGMDSSTGKDYVTAPSGKIVGKVTGTVAPVFEKPLTGDAEYNYLRYVAIKNEEGTEYTFHRFNISVTGYRFELTTGGTPQCALFFIGKFQGDDAAKAYLKSLGFKLKDINDKITNPRYEIPAGTKIPPESEPGDSPVVLSGDAYLFEAYLMHDIDKKNADTYTKKFSAIAQATFQNDETQDSKPKQWSFEDAWKNPGDLTSEQKAILDKFLKELGITKQAE